MFIIQGTATNDQFVQIMFAIGKAVATAIKNFSTGELITCLDKNGEKLAQYLGLVFTALMTGQTIILVKPQFSTWKTIKIGTYKTVDAIVAAITTAGYFISGYAAGIMGKPKFTLSKNPTQIELCRATTAQLGFKDWATFKQICARILEFGYMLCPAEVGPQLRLQYTDQPKGEWLLIAMESIADSDGDHPGVFSVGRRTDGEFKLGTGYYDAGGVFDGGRVWVFARRK